MTPPDIVGCLRLALQIAPLAERIQIARGPCSAKAIIFAPMSYKQWKPTDEKTCDNSNPK